MGARAQYLTHDRRACLNAHPSCTHPIARHTDDATIEREHDMTGDKRSPPLDVRAFRKAIGKRLQIEPFGQASIASMGDVLRTTWRRYEDGSKPIPSTVTKLVVYHAVLDELADLDGDDAARALGVPHVPPDLIGVLRDYMHDTWVDTTEAASVDPKRDPRREEKTTADPILVK